MDSHEARWKIIKTLLDGFPSLRKRTLKYLNITDVTTEDRETILSVDS